MKDGKYNFRYILQDVQVPPLKAQRILNSRINNRSKIDLALTTIIAIGTISWRR